MNNRFKFRVWDEVNNKFYSQEVLNALPLNVFLASKHIQQYIGLTDSADNEIYEGDILKISYGAMGDVIGQVLYEADHGGYIFQWERKGPNQNYINLNCDVAFESVIIGNVNENSELLN